MGLKGNFVQLEDGPAAVTGDNPSINATFPSKGKGRRWGRTIRKSEDLPKKLCPPSWTVEGYGFVDTKGNPGSIPVIDPGFFFISKS